MQYKHFKEKLNSRIFLDNDDLNLEILTTVINSPERYIGLFRVTNAKTKLIQNLTQSHEIKFGDFIEDILTEYIAEMGYENLDKNIGFDEKGDRLNSDQIFKDKSNFIYLIEQKIRDDHDSTKKRGQYSNFIKKIRTIKEKYPNHKIIASMWFSDSWFKKNRKYYLEQIANNTDDLVKLNVFYGDEIFTNLFKRIDIWEELISHLRQNKTERCKDILSVPDFDTSVEIKNALMKLKSEEPKLIKKLLSNNPKFVELRKELFPTGANLKAIS